MPPLFVFWPARQSEILPVELHDGDLGVIAYQNSRHLIGMYSLRDLA